MVGGFWPWLRQGWAFLDDPAGDGSTLVLPEISYALDGLTAARFSTFRKDAGARLAQAFRLKAWAVSGEVSGYD